MYTELNSLLAGVQTSIITDHKFIEGDRVPDKGEILTTLEDRINAAIKIEDDLLITEEDEARQKLLDARKQIYQNKDSVGGITDGDQLTGEYKTLIGYLNEINKYLAAVDNYEANKSLIDPENPIGYAKDAADKFVAYETAKAAYDEIKDSETASEEEKNNAKVAMDQAKAIYDAANALLTETQMAVEAVERGASEAEIILTTRVDQLYTSYYKIKAAKEQSVSNMDYLRENSGFSAEFLAEIETYVTPVVNTFALAEPQVAAAEAGLEALREKLAALGIEVNPFVKPEEPTTTEPPKKDTTILDTRYHSDDNKIVLLAYENGTRFILNFNSFDITTTINGVVYSVDAYGYVVLK